MGKAWDWGAGCGHTSDCDVLASVLGSLGVLRRSSCYGLEGGGPMLGVLDGILMTLSCSRPKEGLPLRMRARCVLKEDDSWCRYPKRRVSGRWREAPTATRAPPLFHLDLKEGNCLAVSFRAKGNKLM